MKKLNEKNAFANAAELNTKNATTSINPYQWTGLVVILFLALLFLKNLYAFWQADIAYALGHNYNTIGEYQKAYPLLDKAVQMRANEPVFEDELALNSALLVPLFVKAKQEDQASQLAQRAIFLTDDTTTNHPNNILSWKNRVRVFYALSEVNPAYLAQALAAMEKAHSLAPTDAKIVYNLGVLYGQNNKLEQGIEIFQEAVKLRPTYKEAYFAMGLFYHELGTKDGKVVDSANEQKAVDMMHYVLQNFSPNDKQILDTLKSWGEK